MTEKELDDYIFAKIGKFAEMFGNTTVSIGKNGIESKTTVPKVWQDLLIETIRAEVTLEGGIYTTDRKVFEIFRSFWKETNNFTLDNDDYWNIVDVLTEKLDELTELGEISSPSGDNGMLASEALACETYKLCSLKDENGNIVDCIMVFRQRNVIETFLSIIKTVTEDKTDKYDMYGFVGASNIVYYLCYNKPIPVCSILYGLIAALGIARRERPRFTQTYLAIDDTGLVKIGKTSDFIRRLNDMSIGNPTIKMLAVFDGDSEKRWHNRFASKNKKGEWFHLSKSDIKDLIQNNKVIWKNPAFDNMIKDLI